MRIRQEREADYPEIYRLVKEAFATAEHADGHEQDLVEALRKGPAYLPELALVAEEDGRLAGHILLTRASVGGDPVLVLAPLSVRPAFQRQGVGTALMREAHRIARVLGYDYILVLGSEHYYPRVGYRPAEELGVTVPAGFPSANFMALRLQEEAEPLRGEVVYPPEFGL
nr:N-acetyltransferase [uncultured Oscillibacter sp.]